MRKHCFASFVIVIGAVVCLKTAVPEARSGAWEPAGALGQARAGASAVRLPDGRALITGGTGLDGTLTTTELFGPGGSFSRVAPMIHARSQHISVVLDDGRVLVAGGKTQGGAVFSSAELYDPRTDTWTDSGVMSASRVGHTATLLPDGRVLIAGGQAGDVSHATLEIFNPGSNQFESLPLQLSSPRTRHGEALLPDGRVLLAGGSSGTETLRTTDIFDSRAGTVSRGPDLLALREGFTATTLLDGRVLIAGGSDGSVDLASAELFDPVTLTSSPTAPMTTGRRGHLAFLLPGNNRVLLVGGDPAGTSAELFTPWRGAFQATGNLQEARSEAAGAPVGLEGSLVLAGGRNRSLQLDSSRLYRFATIRTDQQEYSPGDTITIRGSGWQPGERVTLLLQGFPKTRDDRTLTATADASGNIFNNEIQQDGRDPGKKFSVTAFGSRSEGQAVFAVNESANLDQCANGPLGTDTGCASSGDWVNGNLNSSKAHYLEGDSVPYRLRITGLTAGATNTVTIEWDTTKSGKHALDYITTYNRTQAANPCAGVSSCGIPTTFPIPPDPSVSGAGVGQAGGVFTLYNGTISAVSAYAPTGAYSNDSSAAITISFSVPAGQTSAVLAWGGHIATRMDWGALYSAVAISGSPFHMRILDLNGSGGNQDRALSNDAAIFPGSITIIKQATPKASTSFSFTASPSPLTNFSVVGDDSTANTKFFGSITTFTTYTVTEDPPPSGWTFDNISPCTVVGAGGSSSAINNATRSVAITLKEGDSVTCTFNNYRLAATLVVIKHVINDSGGTAAAGDFTMSVSGANPSKLSFAGVESPGTSLTVDPGVSYSVGESGPSGYASTFSPGCSGTIAAGTTTTCTVTNDDKAAHLTLAKTVTNDNGGTATATAWTLSASGPTPISGPGGVTNAAVSAGTYVLSESGPSGYTPGAWSCTGTGLTSQSGAQITVALDANVTCTINNNDNATRLTLVKTVTNDNGGTAAATDWTLSASGPTPISGAGGVSSDVTPGLYTLSESAGPGGYTAGLYSCIKNGGATVSGNSITLVLGDTATCTIINDDITPTLTIKKVCTPYDPSQPLTDPGHFTMHISNSANGANSDLGTLGCGSIVAPASIGPINLKRSDTAYAVSELGALGSLLTNYTTSFGGDCDASGKVTLSTLGKGYTCWVLNFNQACVAPQLPGPTQTQSLQQSQPLQQPPRLRQLPRSRSR